VPTDELGSATTRQTGEPRVRAGRPRADRTIQLEREDLDDRAEEAVKVTPNHRLQATRMKPRAPEPER
jgi:hypothetical protein